GIAAGLDSHFGRSEPRAGCGRTSSAPRPLAGAVPCGHGRLRGGRFHWDEACIVLRALPSCVEQRRPLPSPPPACNDGSNGLTERAVSRLYRRRRMAQNGTRATGPRCIALVGPFQSGKTTLLEAILARTGAIQRQGTVEAENTVSDASKEARHHKMSVELSIASTNFMGDTYTFVDCPGSV